MVQTGLKIVALIFLFQQQSSDWFQYTSSAKREMFVEAERSNSAVDSSPIGTRNGLDEALATFSALAERPLASTAVSVCGGRPWRAARAAIGRHRASRTAQPVSGGSPS